MPIDPDDAEVIEEAVRSFLLDVHVSMPAVCKSYDRATQRGDFTPTVKASVKHSDGTNVFEERPTIQHVPVLWHRAGGFYRHSPLAAGDTGVLLFSEDCYAHWRDTGELSVPGDVTRHSIAYPVFLPGLWPDGKPMADPGSASEAVEIVPAGGSIRVSEEGQPGDQVMTANAFMAALAAGVLAAGGATIALGAAGASTAFTAFGNAFTAAAISSSKLKAQSP